jgi:hypothetical protein
MLQGGRSAVNILAVDVSNQTKRPDGIYLPYGPSGAPKDIPYFGIIQS